MNIFDEIKNINAGKAEKTVMSIQYDNGNYKQITRSEMFASVDASSNLFYSAGLQSGDRIIIVAENSPEWVISFLAICSIKCSAVLIDPSLSSEEIMELIEASDARAVLMSPAVKSKLNRRVSDKIPVLDILNRCTAFGDETSRVESGVPHTPDPDTDVAAIIYSSGTTRRATGVMHTHDALIGTTNAAIDFNDLNGNDKMLVVIPLNHIYGMITCMIGPLMLGSPMHFIESMSSANVLKAFSEFKPTIFSCVPRVFEAFKEQILNKIAMQGKLVSFVIKSLIPVCNFARRRLGINLGKKVFKSVHEVFGGQIRIFCAAGAPLDSETAYFYYALGFNLFLNYGLTETNVPIIANSFSNYTLHSCGKCYDHVSIKIAEPDANGSGEILVKTPFMMKAYFRQENETALSYDEDGWFKTGDVAAIDAKGNVSITGRVKDNIILSTGKKISPDYVESKLLGILGVKEIVICGIPVASGSFDEIHAFIVADKNAEAAAGLIEKELLAREDSMSQHVKISAIHYVDEIPRTSLQKPKRYLLKRNYLESQSAAVKSGVKAKRQDVDVESELFSIISEITGRDAVITPELRLYGDLSLDSLDTMDLCVRVEERTGRSIDHLLERDITVGELIDGLKISNSEKTGKFSLDFSKFPYKKGFVDNMAFAITKFTAKVFYRFEIKGLENLPKDGGFILCPNHESYLDSFLVLMNLPKKYYEKICCMSKKEVVSKNNIISRIVMRVAGIIPVDRTGNTVPAMKRCLEKLQENWVVLIHPEGTRSLTGDMGVFKSGASKLSLDSHRPIVPVRIKGAYDIFPVGQPLPKLFDKAKLRRYKLEIVFGSPIEPVGVDVPGLTSKLRDRVLGL